MNKSRKAKMSGRTKTASHFLFLGLNFFPFAWYFVLFWNLYYYSTICSQKTLNLWKTEYNHYFGFSSGLLPFGIFNCESHLISHLFLHLLLYTQDNPLAPPGSATKSMFFSHLSLFLAFLAILDPPKNFQWYPSISNVTKK